MRYRIKSNIVWGNVNLRDYNGFAFYCNIFERPERDVEIVSVPGRNEDLIFDNGRYKNVDRTYQVQIVGMVNAMAFVSALTEQLGYQRLQDEYEDNVYMEARLKEKPEITHFVGDAVSITLTFDRKPYKWLMDGEEVIYGHWSRTYDSNLDYPWRVVESFAFNATIDSRPLIRISYAERRYSTFYVYKTDHYIEAEGAFPLPDSALILRGKYSQLGVYDPERTVSPYVEIDCETKSYTFSHESLPGDIIETYSEDYEYPKITAGPNYFYVVYGQTEGTSVTPSESGRRAALIYPRYKML